MANIQLTEEQLRLIKTSVDKQIGMYQDILLREARSQDYTSKKTREISALKEIKEILSNAKEQEPAIHILDDITAILDEALDVFKDSGGIEDLKKGNLHEIRMAAQGLADLIQDRIDAEKQG
jgi:hypothetical protein